MITKASEITVGDVIRDSYENPAVVLSSKTHGITVMQTVGSDRGNIYFINFFSLQNGVQKVTGEASITWAKQVAREEWARQGLKQSQFAN